MPTASARRRKEALPLSPALPKRLPVSGTRPDAAAAREAVRTLISHVGENPDREGMIDTPDRFVRAWNEFFVGYGQDPAEALSRTFTETDGFDNIVLLRGIGFESHCEHHIVPIIGKAHVAYLPNDTIVGLSKLARVVDIFAKRMQSQENLTVQIARAIEEGLKPRGVAVVIEAEHMCMTTRGVRKAGVDTVTQCLMGEFKHNPATRREFFTLLHG